ATSPKSNRAYMAIEDAIRVVKDRGDLPVPMHLRNAPTGLMKDLGYGVGYHYAHSYEGNFVNQEYLPDALSGEIFYQPGDNTRENQIRTWLTERWKPRAEEE
ncbi:MAG: replication-associated recombination protein A, partial [Bacteroidota bacterium]